MMKNKKMWFQIRRDNPYRKPSSDGKQPSAANQNSLSYDRIFSDLSASDGDELLNISAIGSSRKENEKAAKVRDTIFGMTIQSDPGAEVGKIQKSNPIFLNQSNPFLLQSISNPIHL